MLWLSLANVPGETTQESIRTAQPAAVAFPLSHHLRLHPGLAHTSQTAEEGEAGHSARGSTALLFPQAHEVFLEPVSVSTSYPELQ